jgi:hypothetical protein
MERINEQKKETKKKENKLEPIFLISARTKIPFFLQRSYFLLLKKHNISIFFPSFHKIV